MSMATATANVTLKGFGGEDLADLRRQNEDLRAKVGRLENEHGGPNTGQNGSNTSHNQSQLAGLYEQENKELRTTVTRLEQLLELEREERNLSEQKTLSLLTEVKTKWHDREQARVEAITQDRDKALAESEKFQSRLKKLQERLESERAELEKVTEVKASLKAKLKECKTKLETAVAKYEEEVSKVREMEKGHVSLLESSAEDKQRLEDEISKLKAQIDLVRTKMDAEEQQYRHEMDKRSAGEREVKKLERAHKNKIEELQHTIEQLRSTNKKLESENSHLSETLHSLEKENDAKLKLKDTKLQDLEGVLSDLENKLKPALEAKSEQKVAPTPEECAKCDEYKAEMSLQKVEIRVLEKKKLDLEDRVKFLREVMIKEEREAKEKATKELKEAKKKLDAIEDKEDEFNSQKEMLEKANKSLQNKLAATKSRLEELQTVQVNSEELRTQVNRLQKKLTQSESTAQEVVELKSTCNTLKHTCLELQDQLGEYEDLAAKLEQNLKEVKVKEENLRKDNEALAERAAQLKVDKNEVKSTLIFTETQLKQAQETHEDVEAVFKREEEAWRSKMEKLTSDHAEQNKTMMKLNDDINALSRNFTLLDTESKGLRDQNVALKEENSVLLTDVQALKDSNVKLRSVMEEMLTKIEGKNDELKSWRQKVEATSHHAERKEHKSTVQIQQLKKLVEHLQAKVDTYESKHKKAIPKSARKVAISLEEMSLELDKERTRNRQLTEELHRKRKSVSDLKQPLSKAAKDLSSKNPLAETGHAIPHRFHKQTNMKVHKCSVCLAVLHFCTTVSVCKFCHRTVHPTCEQNVGQDCGLSSDLALVLKTNNAGQSQGVVHKGFLKIPPKGQNQEWKTVGVQIIKDKLVIEGEKKSIALCPETGFVFIQSTVAYSELLHSSAYDQPHIFKIGYSSGSNIKDTHYFMAKSFQEKAAWIDAIEKVSLTLPNATSPSPSKSDNKPVYSPTKALSKWNVLTFFSEEAANAHIFCALEMTGNDVIFGTSNGIFRTSGHGDDAKLLQGGPDCVFQMALVEDLNEVIAIAGQDRKLVVMREDDLERAIRDPHRKLACEPISSIASCHLFGVGYFNGDVFLCVVDNCLVSLLVRNPKNKGLYEVRYAFSTDQPTTCIHFTPSSVLVVTNKVYEIQLNTFKVSEFLQERVISKQFCARDNYLVGLYQLNEEEFLICFQDYGLFVNRFGERSRPDLRWSVSGQFVVAGNGRQLWMTYHNAVEAIDLDAKQTLEMIQCKNPQILGTNENRIFFVDRRTPDNVVVMARR